MPAAAVRYRINTTHGVFFEDELERLAEFDDSRDNDMVVSVEWRKKACEGFCEVCANPQNPQPENGKVLVRRDAHVIIKRQPVESEAQLGGI